MGLRAFFLTIVPAAALAASCAPIHVFSADWSTAPGGLGGSLATSGGGAVSLSGTGGGQGQDAGLTPAGMAPLKYLCGGSKAECSPDPSSEDCTQGGQAGLGGGASASDAAARTCQLVGVGPPGSQATQVAAVCGVAGATIEGDPCTKTSDCQAGLGCVDVGGVSICHTYCCDSLESCKPTTYCAPVPLSESPKNSIPVCIAATPCTLLDDSTCPNGQTCAIVRVSGETSCVTPGAGMAHQPCPCAAGYTCSWTDNTCLQLCDTTKTGSCGPDALCQGGTLPYPSGIGYCVPLN